MLSDVMHDDMRVAYLIIAHNEFEVLQHLVAALDDVWCDIYIHFDAKVDRLPEIRVEKSSLHILEKRVRVRWGTASQIEAEYALWKTAANNGCYSHYVLLSGTHYPLVSREEIQSYLSSREGLALVPKMERACDYQVDLKMILYDFLPCTAFWKVALKFQRVFHIGRNRRSEFYNGGNWVVLPQEAVDWLLAHRRVILRKYRWTFCGDEFFVPTELMSSPFCGRVLFSSDLLKFDIGRSNARVYNLEDLDELKASGCMFARKLTLESMPLIKELKR